MAKNRESIRSVVAGPFLDCIKHSFQENLLSVMLYGSWVSGDFIPGLSDVNALIILRDPRAEQIERFGREAFRIMRRNRITPLILTRAEFNDSADVFPMEYSDIQERNSVLFGEDETKSLVLKRKNLRHQLEERLRGCVASLRQMVIASRGKSKILKQNLKLLFGTLKSLFRGLLRLKGAGVIPHNGEEIVEHLQREFGVDARPFMELLKLRAGERIDPQALSADVLTSLGELIDTVDRMEIKE